MAGADRRLDADVALDLVRHARETLPGGVAGQQRPGLAAERRRLEQHEDQDQEHDQQGRDRRRGEADGEVGEVDQQARVEARQEAPVLQALFRALASGARGGGRSRGGRPGPRVAGAARVGRFGRSRLSAGGVAGGSGRRRRRPPALQFEPAVLQPADAVVDQRDQAVLVGVHVARELVGRVADQVAAATSTAMSIRIVPRTATRTGTLRRNQNSTGRLRMATKSAIRKGAMMAEAARRPPTRTTTHAATTRTRTGVPMSRLGSSGKAAMVRCRV